MNYPVGFDTLIEIMLGISLSAASGIRVFMPLLVLSTAAVVGHLDLPTNLDLIETPQALAVLTLACTLEVSGYYIPWFDHLLDMVATPVAILVGTIIAASLAPEMNPLMQWTLAVVAGGGTAGLTKGAMNLLRLTSTAASGGLTNPVLATIELVLATVLSVLAVTLPLIAGFLVLGILFFAIGKLWTFVSRVRSPQRSSSEIVRSRVS